MEWRASIRRSVHVDGVGLHSGEPVHLVLRPSPPGSGIVFVRTDLGGVEIPARSERLSGASWATTLAVDGATVGTVEHLLSAVSALGIDDLRVEIDGGEVPILDGSASPFVELLERAGRAPSALPRMAIRIAAPITVQDADRSMTLEPDRGFRIHYAIDFPHPQIGRSEKTVLVRPDLYLREIAPARTFCRLEDVEEMRRAGLARGGSLDNALVVDGGGLLNPPLRFADEFVRHKILDLIGDLALLGAPIEGRVCATRAGHALHARLMRTLLARRDAWALVPLGTVPRPALAEQAAVLDFPVVPSPA